MKKYFILSCLVFVLFNILVSGQIDSQWRGPNRDGVYANEKLLKKWPNGGPKLLWSTDKIGEGFSSAAVTTDRVYITGMIKGNGYLFAFDKKGTPVWQTLYGPEWDINYPGARTTPTVVGNKIYLLSAKGLVVCVGADGKIVWKVNLIEKFKAVNLKWGITESLLVDGDKVFCSPGAKDVMVITLNRHSGKTIWKVKGNGETSAYCSPSLIKHGRKQLLLTMTAKSFVGVDVDSREYLWNHPHVTSYDVNPNTPLYHDGYIFTVSGYGTGGQMFKLSKDGKQINLVWAQNTLDSQIGAAVLVDGYLYGSGHKNRGWHCLDWKTGKVQFSAREIGNKGNIIFSDGMLYCYGENGDVALVKPNPQKFEIVSSFKINKDSGPHWAHPVIRDGLLYIRHGGILMVFSIAG